MKKIVMTGGGTAGHVTPNIALMPALKEAGYDIEYIGSVNGMEKGLIEAQKIPYHGISSGKLRRYFDWKNFTDPFRVLKGYGQAVSLMKKLKPDVVFSKGGFVSVPVVLAAKHCHVPAIIHESDITPGLANKIAIKGAKKVCCNFPETMKYLPADKAVLTGSPIRRELFSGVAENAIKLCNFPDHNKPVILIIGGSLGSKKVNEAVREILPELLKDFYVIHLCGKGNLDNKLAGITGYAQFEYANAELTDMFALADMAISRAGANSICELLALHKPNILIPLSAAASRGDQVLNAKSFKKVIDMDARPSVLFYRQRPSAHLLVKFHRMTPDAVGKVNERLKELMPDQEPKLTVYSVQMVDLYSSSRKFRDEVMIGGLITLIISLIGLIGYTNDEVNRRRKELAIRKVNGATMKDILRIFLKDVLRIALPAILLGCGISYFVAEHWQRQFVEKIPLSAWIFLAGALFVCLVVLICIVYRIWDVANEDPVDSLKSE